MTSPDQTLNRGVSEPLRVSDARLIAELQAVTIGIHLVGLDRLPEVMNPARSAIPHPQSEAA